MLRIGGDSTFSVISNRGRGKVRRESARRALRIDWASAQPIGARHFCSFKAQFREFEFRAREFVVAHVSTFYYGCLERIFRELYKNGK